MKLRPPFTDYAVFLAVAIPLAGLITQLNWDAVHGFHTLDKHLVFRERILQGFDTGDVIPSYATPPTFPMWGMGWLLLPSTSKIYVVTLNLGFTFGGFLYLVHSCTQTGLLDTLGRRVALAAAALYLPWHVANSIEWSQSVHFGLFMVGAALLIQSRVVLSGLAFGLALNVQSDYFAFLPIFALAWWALSREKTVVLRKAAIWLGMMLVLLIPWAIWSYHSTGHVLLTSSNSGHVFYISLGQSDQYPEIEFGDDSEQMYDLLAEELGPEIRNRFYGSVTPEASPVLLREWRRIVISDPPRFARHLWYKIEHFWTWPLYTGEFTQERASPVIPAAGITSVIHKQADLFHFALVVLVLVGGTAAIAMRSFALAFIVGAMVFRLALFFVGTSAMHYLTDLIPLMAIIAGVTAQMTRHLVNEARGGGRFSFPLARARD